MKNIITHYFIAFIFMLGVINMPCSGMAMMANIQNSTAAKIESLTAALDDYSRGLRIGYWSKWSIYPTRFPFSTKDLTPNAIAHVLHEAKNKSIIANEDFYDYLIRWNSYEPPSLTSKLLPFIKQNLTQIILDITMGKGGNSSHILALMINENPNVAKEFLPIVKQNFLNIAIHNRLITAMIIDDSYSAQELLPLVKQHFSALIIHEHCLPGIKKIIIINPAITYDLTLLSLAEKKLDLELFSFICKQATNNEPARKAIEKHLKDQQFAHKFDFLLKTIMYCKYCNNNNPVTHGIEKIPSIVHLHENVDRLFSCQKQYGFDDSAVQTTIMTGLDKEKELIAQGLVPFVHGRRRSYDFVTQLYAFLNATTTGKKINPHFIPTHIKAPATDIAQEKNIRKELLANGNSPYDQKKRQKLLFLNHFMFGNINNSGSNSFLYMLSNNNAGGVNIRKKDIFKMFGLEAMYNKYADKLNALEKEYNEVSPLGQMLQLGIEPKKVQKAVYLTTSGGPKKSLQISDTTSSDQIDTIITHLDEHPKDITEFALINTFDKYGGLNEYGMKISVLDPADYDAESLAKKIVCNNKRDALFSAIQSDYISEKIMIA